MSPSVTVSRASWCILAAALALVLSAAPSLAQDTFTVTDQLKTPAHPYYGQGDPEGYAINGVDGMELTLLRGETYTFQMDGVSIMHPFYISTSASGAGAGIWNEGVTGNFATGNATLTFTVPAGAPDLLWYQCAAHLYMGWRINVVDAEAENFSTQLSGGQEIPANASQATGTVTAALVGNTLTVSGSFEGLESDYTASHLHLGYAGQNGPVTVGLLPELATDNRSGTYDPAQNTFEFDADQLAALAERRIYVNVHSVELPAGEIRGQVLPANTPTFHAVLSGRAEHPANSSQGVGAVMAELSGVGPTVLTLTGAFSGLESDYHTDIGSHIHIGEVHENGPIVIPLDPTLDEGLRSGVFTAKDNTFVLEPGDAQNLIEGAWYVNVHTQAYPPGEIRGQLFPVGTPVFEAMLAGDHETPPVETAAGGSAIAVLDGNTLRLGGSFAGLESDYTASHIHIGGVDVSGGVIFPLSAQLDGDNRGGVYTFEDNSFTLTLDQRNTLYDAGYYVNIHSVDQPPGEIRGQLLVATNLAPDPPVISDPEDGATVMIEGDPDQTLLIAWAGTDPNANPLAFTWQLATDAEFEAIVFDEPMGMETSIEPTFADVDELLADLDVDVGQSITLFHRAISSDGGFLTTGPAASVTFERGMVTDTEPGGEALPFAVSGPAPNPFATGTTLFVDLPTAADVTVTLFDVLGRRVAQQALGSISAGTGQPLQIRGGALAAGTYLYRVEAVTPAETLVASGRVVVLP